MNKPQTIEGRWWIHGDDKPPNYGSLSFHPEEGLQLTVNVPRQEEPTDENFIKVLDELYGNPPTVPQLIHGTDENNQPITLFGCGRFQRSGSSLQDTYRLGNIGVALLNSRTASWDETVFVSAQAKYTLLHNWMGRRLGIESKICDDNSIQLKLKTHERLEFKLKSGVLVRIQGNIIREGVNLLDEMRIQWSHSVNFLFPALIATQTIHDDFVEVFRRLLWLLTDAEVFVEELQLHNQDPFVSRSTEPFTSSHLLRCNKGVTTAIKDRHSIEMVASFHDIESGFGSILNAWFDCHEQLRPVLDLYFAVMGNRSLSAAATFLFFAQALEVYHARSPQFSGFERAEGDHEQRVNAIIKAAPERYQKWLTYKLKYSNQKTLARRLDDILKLHSNEAEKLTAGIESFPDTFRDTRNYYTHYDEKLRPEGNVAFGMRLLRLANATEAILRVCLLKEIGITGEPIEKVIEQCSSVKYCDIKEGAE